MNSTTTLTVTQVAERLHVHPKTVKRLLASGALAYVDISTTEKGASVRITEAQLASFLRKRTRRRQP
jgi:excisionase family DNA binding protein